MIVLLTRSRRLMPLPLRVILHVVVGLVSHLLMPLPLHVILHMVVGLVCKGGVDCIRIQVGQLSLLGVQVQPLDLTLQ